jgi:uncharacterized membrane protein
MIDFLRPFLSRIIAGWVAAFVAYLSTKFGVTLDAETQAGILAVLLGIFTTVYSIVHRVLDKKINPGDAASSHLAAKEQVEVAALKSGVTNYPR